MFVCASGNGDWHLKLVPPGETKRVACMIDRLRHLESFLPILDVKYLAYKAARDPNIQLQIKHSFCRRPVDSQSHQSSKKTCSKVPSHLAEALCEPTALRARVWSSSLLPKRIGSENTHLRARGGLAQPPLEQLF